ncbi:hypothetical protein Tsubulata_024814 [Turnera subulata]|uniref:DUF4283 domain-containing protein n=1 Tax=Turnera subulata TaxID=218843 RepID=A0A9Q0J2Z8_9ROSI|nr:hypothetical protein Tsubulata_024814 [Turnera subulata]
MGGPWTIFKNVHCVQPWTPDFRASTGRIDKVAICVHFPEVKVNRYHPQILTTLGNLVGSSLKLDENSVTVKRGKFAKVAVVVDLEKPLQETVTLDGEQIHVVYEGIPQIYYSWTSTSPSSAQQADNQPRSAQVAPARPVQDPKLGEWMTVQPPYKRPIKKVADPRGENVEPGMNPFSSNRFQFLAAATSSGKPSSENHSTPQSFFPQPQPRPAKQAQPNKGKSPILKPPKASSS